MASPMPTLGGDAGQAGPDYKDMALDLAATARERWSEGSRALRESIVNQPVRALGIALGLGVVLGWLIKRR